VARGKKKQERRSKGFAGLSSLVSDVDTSPPPAAKKEPSSTSASSSPPRPPSQHSRSRSQGSSQTYQEPAQPSSGSSGGKWVLGIAAVIGVLWLIGQSDKPTTSPAPAYSPPAQSARRAIRRLLQPQAPSRPQESKPPVGQDLVFQRRRFVLLGRGHPHGWREVRSQQLHRLRRGSLQRDGGRLQQPLRELPLSQRRTGKCATETLSRTGASFRLRAGADSLVVRPLARCRRLHRRVLHQMRRCRPSSANSTNSVTKLEPLTV
jgi:hypothetical protein